MIVFASKPRRSGWDSDTFNKWKYCQDHIDPFIIYNYNVFLGPFERKHYNTDFAKILSFLNSFPVALLVVVH